MRLATGIALLIGLVIGAGAGEALQRVTVTAAQISRAAKADNRTAVEIRRAMEIAP